MTESAVNDSSCLRKGGFVQPLWYNTHITHSLTHTNTHSYRDRQTHTHTHRHTQTDTYPQHTLINSATGTLERY